MAHQRSAVPCKYRTTQPVKTGATASGDAPSEQRRESAAEDNW